MYQMPIWDKEIPLYDPEIKNEQNDEINTIHFYPLETDQSLPIVIIFPGGGYTFRSILNEGTQIAQVFNEQGFHAAVVNYRVFPYHYPAPLLDAQRAIKLFRHQAAELKIDPDKVFTLGFSAGGHLCGMTAVFPDVCTVYGDAIDKQSHKPNGAILCYPVISADDDKMHRGSFQSLLGESFDLRQAYSLEKRVDDDTCPCFMFHCDGDTAVPCGNSIVFRDSLSKYNIPSQLHIFPGGAHGGGLRENDKHANVWPALAANWIRTFE